jgi:hypothetical protein
MQERIITEIRKMVPKSVARNYCRSRGGMLDGLFSRFMRQTGKVETNGNDEKTVHLSRLRKEEEEKRRRMRTMKCCVPYVLHMNMDEVMELTRRHKEKTRSIKEFVCFANWIVNEFPNEDRKI